MPVLTKTAKLTRCYCWYCFVGKNGGRGRVNPPPETPFHADPNGLLFVSIALTLTEISVDCDYT
jgi:hypothetical protein